MSDYKDRVRSYLEDKPKYIPAVKDILEWEKEHKDDDRKFVWVQRDEYEDYDVHWESEEIPSVSAQQAYQLYDNGVTDRPGNTNKTTAYCLRDREEVEDVLNHMSVDEDGNIQEMHSFPSEDELDDGVFDRVIGYDDVKWLLRRGITTDKITNFLLLGPPGSAKSVFLLALRKMEGSEYIMASESTSAGVLDLMFESKPKYMLIDEFDDMKADHQSVFASYTETGIVKETKYDKDREMKTNTKTFAAANARSNIKDNILDRFTVLEFDEYTEEEFIEICEHVLPMEENKSEEESRTIAEAVWDNESTGDVREAIQIARLSRGDPEKVIGILDKYSDSEDTSDILSSAGF